jgi:hypothetical protein
MANSVKADLSGLERMLKRLKSDKSVKIGIISPAAKEQHDSKSGLTNAEIGTFHEYGTRKMPRRSFLYDPLMERLGELVKSKKKELWKAYFEKNTPEDFLTLIGSTGVLIVEDAFTNGFKGWQPLTARTVRYKERMGYSPNTLITTGHGGLSHSISFEVVKN